MARKMTIDSLAVEMAYVDWNCDRLDRMIDDAPEWEKKALTFVENIFMHIMYNSKSKNISPALAFLMKDRFDSFMDTMDAAKAALYTIFWSRDIIRAKLREDFSVFTADVNVFMRYVATFCQNILDQVDDIVECILFILAFLADLAYFLNERGRADYLRYIIMCFGEVFVHLCYKRFMENGGWDTFYEKVVFKARFYDAANMKVDFDTVVIPLDVRLAMKYLLESEEEEEKDCKSPLDDSLLWERRDISHLSSEEKRDYLSPYCVKHLRSTARKICKRRISTSSTSCEDQPRIQSARRSESSGSGAETLPKMPQGDVTQSAATSSGQSCESGQLESGSLVMQSVQELFHFIPFGTFGDIGQGLTKKEEEEISGSESDEPSNKEENQEAATPSSAKTAPRRKKSKKKRRRKQ